MKNSYTVYTPMRAIKDFFKRYADFCGRSTRSAYWWAMLMIILGVIVVSILSHLFPLHSEIEQQLTYLVLILLGLPTLSLMARRLHDVGKSAWNLLWLLIPWFLLPVCIIFLLFVYLIDMPATGGYVEPASSGLNILDGMYTLGFNSLLIVIALLYITPIILIFYCLKDSERGRNKWGASEKYPDLKLKSFGVWRDDS